MNDIGELKKLVASYKEVFSSEAGKIVIEDLKLRGFIDMTTMDKEPTPLTLSFREGRRSIVLQILNFLNYNEEQLKELEQMQQDAEREDDGRFI